MLNIDGFEADRSNLKRIIAAHIAKDKRDRNDLDPNELMSRRQIDPLVDTLLKHFGKARSGKGGCFSDKKKAKRTSVVPQNIAMNDSMSKWEQPLGPRSRSAEEGS